MHYDDIGEYALSVKDTSVTLEHKYFTMGSTVIFEYIYNHYEALQWHMTILTITRMYYSDNLVH